MFDSNNTPYHLPKDAVWFITGCSSGIGEGLAQYITETTNRVVATARKPASMSKIPDGPNVLKLKLDVTSIDSIESAFSESLAAFGHIDVVVNNAGYTLVGDTEAAGDAEARALMDTNFWGMVDVSKRALSIMRDENVKNGGQRGGVILNISSMGGWVCFLYKAIRSTRLHLPVVWMTIFGLEADLRAVWISSMFILPRQQICNGRLDGGDREGVPKRME
jgi:NADP-dependent 3-hydroxy acid dehydrogenase YdfG